jgi:pimeloyl-ACP methyl ester carboxylesterase
MTMVMATDGIGIQCWDIGEGDPSLVFVHGAAMWSRYWDQQLDHFATRYRCVTIDQRGHGQSDRPDGPIPISRFADDLAEVIEGLGLDRPVVIAHSMGCAVAIEFAARHPGSARALVLNDPPSMEAPDLARYEPLIESFEAGADVADTIGAMVDAQGMLEPGRDPNVRQELLAMVTAPPSVAAEVFRALATWDRHSAAEQVQLPVLHIAAAPPNCPTDLLTAAFPQAVTGQTVGAGHFNAYEVPDQVNAMIDQFLHHYVD